MHSTESHSSCALFYLSTAFLVVTAFVLFDLRRVE